MERFFKINSTVLVALALSAGVLFSASTASAGGDRAKVGYWLHNYKQIQSGPLYERSVRIFKRVLAAADRRKGVEPRLYIIDYKGLPWAQSLADGSIVLTKKAVDFCFAVKDPLTGDSRLAFVIGHELAHQYNGDFWPYKFMVSTKGNLEFSGLKDYAGSPETIMAAELQADQYGIIYASMAGFGTDIIISSQKNFFREWARAVDPTLMGLGANHPSVKQRSIAVTGRLQEVTRRLDLFDLGVIAFNIGRYRESIPLLREFLKYYPGRAVYHNVGSAYLRLALSSYRQWKGEDAIPFELSMEIDSSTRADSIGIGRSEDVGWEKEYRRNMNKAVDYLKKASESDPYYGLSRNNLGVAHILEGRYYNAISELDEALRLMPGSKGVLNNRAVAYSLLGERLGKDVFNEIVIEDMEKASSGGCEAVYGKNLMIISRMAGKKGDDLASMEIPKVISLPEVKTTAQAGEKLRGEGHIISEVIRMDDGAQLKAYRTSGNETVLVKDGIVIIAFKRKEVNSPIKRRCHEESVFSSREQGRGVEPGRGIVFTFER